MLHSSISIFIIFILTKTLSIKIINNIIPKPKGPHLFLNPTPISTNFYPSQNPTMNGQDLSQNPRPYKTSTISKIAPSTHVRMIFSATYRFKNNRTGLQSHPIPTQQNQTSDFNRERERKRERFLSSTKNTLVVYIVSPLPFSAIDFRKPFSNFSSSDPLQSSHHSLDQTLLLRLSISRSPSSSASLTWIEF